MVDRNHKTEWRRGDMVSFRNIVQGKVWDATPMRVVQDEPDLTVLYRAANTWYKRPFAHGDPNPNPSQHNAMQLLEAGDWWHGDVQWVQRWRLTLMRPQDPFAIFVMFSEAAELLAYYVNFQEPFVRTDRCLDTRDYTLDLVILPDLTWHWKDEEDFRLMIEKGYLGGDLDEILREAGEKLLAESKEPGAWFRQWDEWRPPAEWDVPTLTDGWQIP